MPDNRDTKDVTLAVISNQIANLNADVKEVVDMLRIQNGRVRLIESELAVMRSERLPDRLRTLEEAANEVAFIKAQKITDRLRALEDQALPVIKTLKWVAAITGGLLIALLWQIFIGNIRLSP